MGNPLRSEQKPDIVVVSVCRVKLTDIELIEGMEKYFGSQLKVLKHQ
jgi:hypothetical protein